MLPLVLERRLRGDLAVENGRMMLEKNATEPVGTKRPVNSFFLFFLIYFY